MLYSPHTLFRRDRTEARDEYNRTISSSESWTSLGFCRCDDNTQMKVTDAAGQEYVPSYHIVAPRDTDVKAGDYVRVLSGSLLRGEGTVVRVIRLNYLNYVSIYV